MITVKPAFEGYGNGFIVEGHAEYAQKGEDIVCAGVSTLAQSIAEALERYVKLHKVKSKGYLKVSVVDGHGTASNAIMHAFCSGMHLMSQNYPKHVTFILDESEETK